MDVRKPTAVRDACSVATRPPPRRGDRRSRFVIASPRSPLECVAGHVVGHHLWMPGGLHDQPPGAPRGSRLERTDAPIVDRRAQRSIPKLEDIRQCANQPLRIVCPLPRSVGGTGLEPVTPSWSTRGDHSRSFGQVRSARTTTPFRRPSEQPPNASERQALPLLPQRLMLSPGGWLCDRAVLILQRVRELRRFQ
jgi:hypothetical protein